MKGGAYKWLVLCLLVGVGIVVGSARGSGIEVMEFDDPQQEARYSALVQQLRCLVCQNQPLSDSGAELARDMRVVVLRMMKDGASDDEIVGFMVDRYGDFVRYQPPFAWHTAALWLAPFVLVLVAAWVAARLMKQQRRVQLGDEAREKARRLLEE